MSLTALALKSAAAGLALAAPVGPMSLLCMRRTLTQSPAHGLATGLGIAAGDATYAAVAALGLAGVAALLMAWERPLHLAAGVFLLWLGLRAFVRKPAADAAPQPDRNVGASFASAWLLTLTNPPTIAVSAAVLLALAPPTGLGAPEAAAMVTGVFAGSTAWWLVLVAVIATARHAIGPRTRRWIDRLSGGALAIFGLLELNKALAA